MARGMARRNVRLIGAGMSLALLAIGCARQASGPSGGPQSFPTTAPPAGSELRGCGGGGLDAGISGGG